MSIPLPEPAKASQGLARPWAWFPGGNQAMRRTHVRVRFPLDSPATRERKVPTHPHAPPVTTPTSYQTLVGRVGVGRLRWWLVTDGWRACGHFG